MVLPGRLPSVLLSLYNRRCRSRLQVWRRALGEEGLSILERVSMSSRYPGTALPPSPRSSWPIGARASRSSSRWKARRCVMRLRTMKNRREATERDLAVAVARQDSCSPFARGRTRGVRTGGCLARRERDGAAGAGPEAYRSAASVRRQNSTCVLIAPFATDGPYRRLRCD